MSKLYSAALTAALMLFVLSASIAVPLYCRPFYYAHIRALNLAESSGHTETEIREAYDEMMDFCMDGKPFGTGVLRWSESGKAHFADCAVLFGLDVSVLKASAAILLLLAAAARFTGVRPLRVLGRGPCFWSGSLLAGVFLALAALAATGFDRAFVTFHHLFFAGKDNWIFDPAYDEIINVLPEVFFRNCAILIALVLFALCALLVAGDFFLSRTRGA